MNKAIRWQQRFENFEKAYLLLDEVVTSYQIAKLSALEKSGVVKRFDILIEQSWKILQDYMADQGYPEGGTARQAIRRYRFRHYFALDSEAWVNALEQRDLIEQTYDEDILNKLTDYIINCFYFLAHDLYHNFKGKL
jgi:nucleotidyltransferase substrate binding protein (TIGR01987 family)